MVVNSDGPTQTPSNYIVSQRREGRSWESLANRELEDDDGLWKNQGYDAFVCNFGTISRHVTGKDIIPTLGGRMIFIACDNSEGVFGRIDSFNKDDMVNVLWTQNIEVVFVIKSLIVQDMYLTDIAEQFPEQLKYFYGSGLKKLKDKILMGTEFPRL